MFSPAYWMHASTWGYAIDEYGELHRLEMEAWRNAWEFAHVGTLGGTINNSYPAIHE